MKLMYLHIDTEHHELLNNIVTMNVKYTTLGSPANNNSSSVITDPVTSGQQIKTILQENLFKCPTTMQVKPKDLSKKRKTMDVSTQKQTKQKLIELSNEISTQSVQTLYNTNDKACICSFCYMEMPNFKSFLKHMETHISATNVKSNLVEQCPICGKTKSDFEDFHNHMISHVISCISGNCCRQCKKSFDQLDELQRHMLDRHTQNLFKCSICNEIFDTQTGLQEHFKRQHCQECKHIKCNLCPNQIFHDQTIAQFHVSVLHRHQISTPENDEGYEPHSSVAQNFQDYASFSCPFCYKGFTEEYLQYIHILKEHNEDSKNENYFKKMPSKPSNSQNKGNISNEENLRINEKIKNCYICELCNRSDICNEKELSYHMKLHHDNNKTVAVSLQCAYCSEHCKTRNDLENHMKIHQVTCGKYKCNICDEIFLSAIILADHKLTHCKILAGNNCTQCKTILSDKESFYSHQMHHSNTSATAEKESSQMRLPANCIICCQTLQTDIEVKLHANFHLSHMLHKEFICEICNKFCNICKCTETSVAKCKECTNQSNETELQVQIETKKIIHTIIKQYTESSKTTDILEQQQKQIPITEEINLECHICKNILPTPFKLQTHLIEHNFMEVRQYKCYVCSSVFTTATGLQCHILNHDLTQRPYECSDCKIYFFFEIELENHKYLHTLQAKYKCPTFNSIFYDDHTLQQNYKICTHCSNNYSNTCKSEHFKLCLCKKVNDDNISNDEDGNMKEIYKKKTYSSKRDVYIKTEL